MNKMHRYVAKCNRKAPTNHKQPYTVFSPHVGPAPLAPDTQIKSALHPSAEIPSRREVESRGQPNVLESFIQIMSIDPGIRNCGLRIEQRRLLDNVLIDVKTVIMVRINFHEEDHLECKNSGTVALDTSYYTRSTEILDKFLPYAIQCQYILIESQLPINYSMVRMSQHIITYLCIGVKNRGNRPLIIEIDPHLKSRLLNAPSKMKKPELKKWCRQKALEVLLARGDNVGHDAILKVGKGDDMGDTVCQCEAWWVILCGQLHAPPLPHFSGFRVNTRPAPSTEESGSILPPWGVVDKFPGLGLQTQPLTEVRPSRYAENLEREGTLTSPGLDDEPVKPMAVRLRLPLPPWGMETSGVNVPTGRPDPTSSPDSETAAEIASARRTRLQIRSTNPPSTNESPIAFRPSIKLRISKTPVPDC